MEAWKLTLTEAAGLIAARKLSPLELVQSVIERIQARETDINAFVDFNVENVLVGAKALNDHPSECTPLHGIPITLKDLIDWRGVPTTASSDSLPRTPARSDAHVSQLLRRAGATFLGKVHTHEFAYGMTTPQTNNPLDLERSVGGSSGGSAAAVAAGFGPLSLGTDTGGSIRVPAALCGVVGLKPTYGLVGRTGLNYLSWSLDHIGPLAKTVWDVATAMNHLTGEDPADQASFAAADQDFTRDLEAGIDGLRIGLPKDFFFDHCEPSIVEGVHSAAKALETQGAKIVEVQTPHADATVGIGNEITAAESGESGREVLTTNARMISDDIRLKFEAGTLRSASSYIHALRAREAVKRSWQHSMGAVDVILTPTTPMRAPRHRQQGAHPITRDGESVSAALIRFTYCANITGLPALTVPLKDGFALPAGLQIIGRPLADTTVLRVGRAYERA